MRINNILEGINRAVDALRVAKDIAVKGHFVAVSTIKKSMGPYKEYRIVIDYVNLDTHDNYTFISNTCMERCPAGEEHKLEELCTAEAITKFFIKWDKYRESIIVGDYGCE